MNTKCMQAYFDHIKKILDTVVNTQSQNIMSGAIELAAAVEEGRNIFAFGCNHAALCTLELYYRTGGLAVINPLRGPGITLDVEPVTLTTQMERLTGYGQALLDQSPINAGDLLIIHSVSGRNAVTIDMAMKARELGIKTICLTNLNTSTVLPARHSSGLRLFETCDIVIDNCGDYGDASMEIEGFAGKIAPTSTTVGTAILNAMMLEACALLMAKGIEPPVYMSSNVPDGDAHNDKIMDAYKDQIHYLKR